MVFPCLGEGTVGFGNINHSVVDSLMQTFITFDSKPIFKVNTCENTVAIYRIYHFVLVGLYYGYFSVLNCR